MAVDWDLIKNFTEDEMRCKCGCGRADMDMQFMVKLDKLRDELGFPLPVSSGFRCPEYNNRVSSTGLDGPHTTGKAADIIVARGQAYRLMTNAFGWFSGIGVDQKGAGRFIHLDTLENAETPGPRPTVWSY